jgi:splicing factor U2AF subunit
MELAAACGPPPTRVVCLENCVQRGELLDDAEYGEIVSDMREEAGKYGAVLSLAVPRPGDPDPPGVGKVCVARVSVCEGCGRVLFCI